MRASARVFCFCVLFSLGCIFFNFLKSTKNLQGISSECQTVWFQRRFLKVPFRPFYVQGNHLTPYTSHFQYLILKYDFNYFGVSEKIDWLQSLKQFFLNVSYILVASHTLMEPSE